MPLYEISEDGLQAHPSTQFAEVGLYERGTVQRVIRDNISIIAPLRGPAGDA